MRRSAGWLGLVVGLCWVAACGSDDAVFDNGNGSTNSAGGSTAATGGMGAEGGMGGFAPMCPHEGPEILDPNTLEVCPMCAGGARCLPNGLIPDEVKGQLGACDATNTCVPDDFIKTGGNFIAQTCASVAGAEGRCISECLPQVAAQANLLPQDICPEFQRCVPCYDPISGEESGACSLSCDPGPAEPPVTLPGCCDGLGTCVPKNLLSPSQADQLPEDSCPTNDGNDYLCAPTAAVEDPNWSPEDCTTDTTIGGGKPGVCLPGCLITGWFEDWATSQSTCPENHKCAPCDYPLTTTSTGACDL